MISVYGPGPALRFEEDDEHAVLRLDEPGAIRIDVAIQTRDAAAAPSGLVAITADPREPAEPEARNGYVVPGRPPLRIDCADDGLVRVRAWRPVDGVTALRQTPVRVADWEVEPALDLMLRVVVTARSGATAS